VVNMSKSNDETPDYYSVLGVKPTATADEIRKAYRKLVCSFEWSLCGTFLMLSVLTSSPWLYAGGQAPSGAFVTLSAVTSVLMSTCWCCKLGRCLLTSGVCVLLSSYCVVRTG